MLTAVADTSIQAYREIPVKRLSASQERLMRVIRDGCDYSRAELAILTGIPLQGVCGRVNELITAGRLEHGSKRTCSRTGQTINPVRLPIKQRELF